MNKGEGLVMGIPEFATKMQISKGLAYDLARRDALPIKVIKLGRRLVLSRRAVEALLEAGKPEVGKAKA